MSWLDRFKGNAPSPTDPRNAQQDFAGTAEQRSAAWQEALNHRRLPEFVEQRLKRTAEGKLPWLSTMTPAELSQTHRYRIRPLSVVSGTCWYHYGYSWTNGHASGWHSALDRIRSEAVAMGANAVVDVHMRKIDLEASQSMDFTLVGTAIRLEGLPPGKDPVIATVSALEFVRLLEANIVPCGIAIGAHYEWLYGYGNYFDAAGSWQNQPLQKLGNFWEYVRRQALLRLKQDTAEQGNGALAHTHFGQLLRLGDQNNVNYLGRHIVIATTVEATRSSSLRLGVRPVIDMCNGRSPLLSGGTPQHNSYDSNQEEGSI